MSGTLSWSKSSEYDDMAMNEISCVSLVVLDFGCPTFKAGHDGLLLACRTLPVQKHLEKVYATLAAALLVSALGTYVNMATGLGGFLAAIGFVVCATWLTVTEATAYNLNKR